MQTEDNARNGLVCILGVAWFDAVQRVLSTIFVAVRCCVVVFCSPTASLSAADEVVVSSRVIFQYYSLTQDLSTRGRNVQIDVFHWNAGDGSIQTSVLWASYENPLMAPVPEYDALADVTVSFVIPVSSTMCP